MIQLHYFQPHSTGPRVRDPPAVTFKDDIEIDDGPVVCADDEPQLKSDKQEKDKGFFAFFKKKKKVLLKFELIFEHFILV